MNNYNINVIPYFTELEEFKLTRTAEKLFGVISIFFKNKDTVYVSRKPLSGIIKCSVTTISTAITILEKNGLIKRNGTFKYAIFPEISLTEKGSKIINKIKSFDTKEQETPKEEPEEITQTVQIIQKNEEEPKNIDTSNLTKFGITKNQAKKILAQHPKEIIDKQINNLENLLKENKNINNTAGWLINAIKNNYEAPPKKEQTQEWSLKKHLEEKKRKEEEELNKLNKEKEARLKARQQVSQEEYDSIYQEELEVVRQRIRKIGTPEKSVPNLIHLVTEEQTLSRLGYKKYLTESN